MVMSKIVWVVVALAVICVFAYVAWNEIGVKAEEGKILDVYPEKEGIVLTVSVDGKLYKLWTNATTINVSKPVKVVFEKGRPIAVVQEKTYKVLDWKELRTIEEMPTVKTP